MKNNSSNLFKNIASVLVLLTLSAFALTIFLKNFDNSSDTASDGQQKAETVTEIDVPVEEVEVSRKSEVCTITAPTELPENWPSDIPIPDAKTSVNSRCLQDNPRASEVEITVDEAYSYLAFAYIQDVKLYSWGFSGELPGLNPPEQGLELRATKGGRRLTLVMKDSSSGEKPSTLIRLTEYY